MRLTRRRPSTGPSLLALVIAVTLLVLPAAGHAADDGPGPGPGSEPTRSVPAEDGPRQDGAWRIVETGFGRYSVRWTSPKALPLTSDRPRIEGQGLSFAPVTVGPDGRSVHSVVTAATPPEAAELDVVLSGERIDEPATGRAVGPVGPVEPVEPGEAAAPAPRRPALDAADPASPGPYETVSTDYRLPTVRLTGMRTPVEVAGHVVEPARAAATGPRPLVLFLPGRHEVCYDPADPQAVSRRWPCAGRFEEVPTHLGFRYLQQLLASQGYATVSVAVNGVNAQDDATVDGGAAARAELVDRHLEHWVDVAVEHQVDLENLVLVGHSRGGEGVDRASIRIRPDAPYRIAGQVLLAPTDLAAHTAPYVPTVTVLPSCDGDVSDLQGQRYTDTARDLIADDTALKSSVLVMGANHNFFNTEWTPGSSTAPSVDDWSGPAQRPCGRRTPQRLTADEQRDVARAYVAGSVDLFATGRPTYLPLLDGSPTTVPSLGDADVRSHAVGGGRDVRRPGSEATPTRASGGAVSGICNGRAPSAPVSISDCLRQARGVVTPHWVGWGDPTPRRPFWQLTWAEPGAIGGLRFDRPLDVGDGRLELRTIIDPRPGRAVDLRVRLTDGSGATAVLEPVGGRLVAPLPTAGPATKLWAQAVVVDTSSAGPAEGVDLTDVRAVELVGGAGGGRVWVADVAAAPAGLAPVPDAHAPFVRLGELTRDEGDPPAGRSSVTRIARVPFTITGPVVRPGRLKVVTDGTALDGKQVFTVDVAPGQSTGSVPVRYAVDRRDSQARGASYIRIWPLRGLTTDDYAGSLTIRDDDPEPRVSARVTRRVREGRSIVVTAHLSEPTTYDSVATFTVVPGPGPRLRGTDLPRAWARRHGLEGDLDQPLARLGLTSYGSIPAGRASVRFVIPVRADRVRESLERVRVRVDVLGTRRWVTGAVGERRR